jgi:pectinesterase
MKPLRWISAAGIAVAAAALAVSNIGSASACAALSVPGTATRPILSAAEAAGFTAANYFGYSGLYTSPTADPWRPAGIKTRGISPDYVVGVASGVGGATHSTVQAAVNAAYSAGGTTRKYLKILPGTYTGTVFIPAGSPPLTIYGSGHSASEVNLEFTVDATITPAAWATLVNPVGQYVAGDPAWAMYNSCATKTSATVALCATVVWAQSTDIQFANMTITNTLLDTVNSGTHQAVALRTDADRTELDGMRLISRQDTFYINANDTTSIARASVKNSYIEGDTDFVFGKAAAVFEKTEFRIVSTRKAANAVIFAPNTTAGFRYGFLVQNCRITADAGYVAAPTGHFGRAWDQGASATGYIPGTTANGQTVIRDTHIGAGYDTVSPWSAAATTNRPYAGNAATDRNLDDVNFNRLWEYHNQGEGAQTVVPSASA